MDIAYRPARQEDLEEAERNGAANRALITLSSSRPDAPPPALLAPT